MAVQLETGPAGLVVMVEPELRAGLVRRVFVQRQAGSLDWASYRDWSANGERARFYGFHSGELPDSMRSF